MNGGVRPGAGRKKKAVTLLKEQSIRENQGEAEKCLAFFKSVRDNNDASLQYRMQAAELLLDRIWGKSKQEHQISGDMTVTVKMINYDDRNDTA